MSAPSCAAESITAGSIEYSPLHIRPCASYNVTMAIFLLENTIKKYHWGDPDLIPEFLGFPNPEREPYAELWLGDHPLATSVTIGPGGERVGLDELIARDPVSALGPDARTGYRLPFLFKLLALGRPLSIQVHPSRLKASRGFEREERSVLPLDATERNYVDMNHKPEFLVALDCFEGMCGFRPIDEIVDNIKMLAGERWRRYAGRLAGDPGKMELAVLFYNFIAPDAATKATVLAGTRTRIDRILARAAPDSAIARTFAWIPRLMDEFPGDMGAMAPILLNTFDMKPGQGLFVAPGQPHAYLRGSALEIMGNSDNKVRAGLTHKRVDLAEFISVLDFDIGPLSFIEPAGGLEAIRAGRTDSAIGGFIPYPVESDEFSLAMARLEGRIEAAARPRIPEILLCMDGNAHIEGSDGCALPLSRGSSVFIEAAEEYYTLYGNATLFRASTARPERDARA